MEKLTLKEIAGYLPYNLQLLEIRKPSFTNLPEIENIITWSTKDVDIVFGGRYMQKSVKPILNSLEMLTKTIFHNGVEIIPLELISKEFDFDFINGDLEVTNDLTMIYNSFSETEGFYFPSNFWLNFYEKLYELHIDIHGLIPRGLAIDKSTLNSK